MRDNPSTELITHKDLGLPASGFSTGRISKSRAAEEENEKLDTMRAASVGTGATQQQVIDLLLMCSDVGSRETL